MIYSFLVAVVLILFLILVVFVYFILVFNFRTTSGFIYFDIDTLNKRILRHSKKEKYLSIIFDAKKSNFAEFNFLPLSEFYTFFDAESSKKIKEILTLDLKYNTELVLKLNKENKIPLTAFEKFLSKIDNKTKRSQKIQCHLKLTPIGDYKIIGSIYWATNQNEKKISLFETKTIEKNYTKGPYLAVCGLIKPYYFINQVSDEIINNFVSKLGFDPSDIKYYNTEGIGYFIFKKPNQKKINTLIETIKDMNKNTSLNSLVDAVGLVEIKQIINEADLEENIKKFQFILFSIKNKKDSNVYCYLPLKTDLNKLLIVFVKKFEIFSSINKKEQFEILTTPIRNFASDNLTSMRFKKVIGRGMSNDEWKFFAKIPYIIFKYEMTWINYIIRNQIENRNTIIKITQENFIKNLNFANNDMPTFLVYSFNNNFSIDKLKDKIIELKKLKVATGFYIKDINKPLMNLINITQIRILVIANEISTQINNLSILYDCIYILHIAKSNQIFLLYELKNKELDPYIVKKAGVTAYYEPFI